MEDMEDKMNLEIQQAIAELIAEKIGCRVPPKDYDLDLEKAARMTGADAYEFIEEYAKRYSVDMSFFDFSEYFYPEGISLLDWLNLLTCGLIKTRKKPKTLSINHLAEIARQGRWPAKS